MRFHYDLVTPCRRRKYYNKEYVTGSDTFLDCPTDRRDTPQLGDVAAVGVCSLGS